MKCPRCGGTLAFERFYGPCSDCVDELRQLKAPAPDSRFMSAIAANGLPTTNYIGPRIDRRARCAESASEQPDRGRHFIDVETKGRV